MAAPPPAEAAPPPAAPRRVYVDGVFDLFHAAHLEFLRRARAAGGPGPVALVVGVVPDGAAGWKRPPVIPHAQRVALLEACRLADEVVADPPLVITDEFLDGRGIDLVVHGDDDLQEEFFRAPRARGIMRYVPYTREGPFAASTSAIIARVRGRADLAAPPRHPGALS